MKITRVISAVCSFCALLAVHHTAAADNMNGFGSTAVAPFSGYDTSNNFYVAYTDSSTNDLRISSYSFSSTAMQCQGSLGQPTRSGSTLSINGRPSASGHFVVVPVFNHGNSQTEIWARTYLATDGGTTTGVCNGTYWSSWTQLPNPTDWVNTVPSVAQVGSGGYFVVVGALSGSTNVLDIIHSTSPTSWTGSWSQLPALPTGESVSSAPGVEQYNGYLWVAITEDDTLGRQLRYTQFYPSTGVWSNPSYSTTYSDTDSHWGNRLGAGYCVAVGGGTQCHPPQAAPSLAGNQSEGVIWLGYVGNNNQFYSNNFLTGYASPWYTWFDTSIDLYSTTAHSSPTFGFRGTWNGNGLSAFTLRSGTALVEEVDWTESTYSWGSFYNWPVALTE